MPVHITSRSDAEAIIREQVDRGCRRDRVKQAVRIYGHGTKAAKHDQ